MQLLSTWSLLANSALCSSSKPESLELMLTGCENFGNFRIYSILCDPLAVASRQTSHKKRDHSFYHACNPLRFRSVFLCRSMYTSCSQLAPEMCQSETFYETDLKGNRRHCVLTDERCTVDTSFVCNASMPICQVRDESPSEGSLATAANRTGLPPAQATTSLAAGITTTSLKTDAANIPSTSRPHMRADAAAESHATTQAAPHENQQLPEAIVQSVIAAAEECLSVGLSVFDVEEVINATLNHGHLVIKSPAEMSLREAVEVALLAGVSQSRLLQKLQDAGFEGAAPPRRARTTLAPRATSTQPEALEPPMIKTIEVNPHGPDRVVIRPHSSRDAAPSTSTSTSTSTSPKPADTTTSQPNFPCSTLCSKQEVSDCEAIEPQLCASEEFYLTSKGLKSLCSLEDGKCQPGERFGCGLELNCTGDSSLGRMDGEAVDHFCKSLCFKSKVPLLNRSQREVSLFCFGECAFLQA